MDKDDIADLIEEKHQILFDWIEKQPVENWGKGPEGKWTISQQILHLANSLQALNKSLIYPRVFFKYRFGTSKRESRDYDTIVKKFQEKLIEKQHKAKKVNRKIKKTKQKDRERLLTRLQIQSKKLQYKIKRISDENLDTLVLPHPFMGKMTVREFIMWTAYHTEHHTKILKKNYAEENYK